MLFCLTRSMPGDEGAEQRNPPVCVMDLSV